MGLKHLTKVYTASCVVYSIWSRYVNLNETQIIQMTTHNHLDNIITGSVEGIVYGLPLLFIVPYTFTQSANFTYLRNYPIFGGLFSRFV